MLKSKNTKFNKTSLAIDNETYVSGTSLYLLKDDNKFRELLFKIVTSKKFEYFIFFIILASSVQLALENPLNDPQGTL